MAKTYSELLNGANTIKNETVAGANTATRVGTELVDIVEKIQQVDTDGLDLGTTPESAFRGDYGQAAYQHANTDGNPHNTVASEIGSTPEGGLSATTVQGAINELDSEKVGKTTKINGYSLNNDINLSKSDVGLSNVDNTSDVNKPISEATQNALSSKADLVGGKIPSTQLPAYVDDVLEYATLTGFPVTGESGKIYVALDTNLTYRWSGTAYVEISKSLALGETADTAYRGDRGKTAYDHSQTTGNPHNTAAAQVSNTPAGSVSATTVQGAINELAGDIVQVETDLNERSLITKKTINLFNALTVISGQGIDNNGSVNKTSAYLNWKTSAYIPVVAGNNYYLTRKTSGRYTGFQWADANYQKIVGYSTNIYNTILTAPANAAYFIFNISAYGAADSTDVMMVQASSAHDYIPYRTIETEQVDGLDDSLSVIKNDIGDGRNTITLNSSSEHYNIVWDGSKFVSSSGYITFIITPIIGRQYQFPTGANYYKVSTEFPTINGTGGETNNITINSEREFVTASKCYISISFIASTFTQYTYAEYAYGIIGSYEIMPLKGKKVVFFGDSILEGIALTGQQKKIPVIFSEISGCYTKNGGIGGTQLGSRADISILPDTASKAYANIDIPNLVKAWAYNDWSTVDSAITWLKNNASDDNSYAINQLKSISINDTDIVIIHGGTNDLNASTFGTHTSPDQRTLKGGIKYIVNSLLAVKPSLSIYFFTPLPRITSTLQNPEIPVYSDDYRAGDECSFLNLVKSIVDESHDNHIPCGNIYHEIGINQYNIQSYGGGRTGTDYTHITKSYKMCAQYMYRFIVNKSTWGGIQ